MLTFSQIQELERRYQSPFYIVDRQKFEHNYEELSRAFMVRYPKFILAYSYKTNYIPYLCILIRRKGGWAEVVSRMEYDLALKIGQEPEKIIFNGPVKSQEDIALALDNGSIVNLDSEQEIPFVLDYARTHPHKPVKVGLRINIGLSDSEGVSHIQNRLNVGRFGFDPDPQTLLPAIGQLTTVPTIRIHSLHGHCSTVDRSIWGFEVISKTLIEIAEKGLPDTVEYINIGGGFFGYILPAFRWCQVPSFEEYAESVCAVMNGSPWARKRRPTLVIEPGTALAGDALGYLTRVVSVKRIRSKLFVIVDGSAFHVKPTFHAVKLPHQFLLQNPEAKTETFDVVGSTCMEKDILLSGITGPLPQPGDFLKIDNAGAYTVVLTPPFINPAPAILVLENGDYKRIRQRQTLDGILQDYWLDEREGRP